MSKAKPMAIILPLLMVISVLAVLGPFAPQAVKAAPEPEPPVVVFLRPGVGDPYKPGWSHTVDTLRGTQGGAAQIQHLLDNYVEYAPIAGSVGDIEFEIEVIRAINRLDIYVSPYFSFTQDRLESVWTDITNDYGFISVSRRPAYDPWAPGWWRIRIGVHRWFGTSMTIQPDLYRVRIFALKVTDAGVFHFKIVTSEGSIGVGNYPILVVKGEVNPAFIKLPVFTGVSGVSGHVLATAEYPPGSGITARAHAWFGPGDESPPGSGLYIVYLLGLAAGVPDKPETYPTWTVAAEASGFPPVRRGGISLRPGQSRAERTLALSRGPIVTVTVFSKHGTGEIPWHNLWQPPFGTNNPYAPPDPDGPKRDVLLELTDEEGKLVAFVASDAYGIRSYPAPLLVPPLDPLATSFVETFVDARGLPAARWDGHALVDRADLISGFAPGAKYIVAAYVTGYVMTDEDAWQRKFTVPETGVGIRVQFDLRRSNWFEVTVYHASLVSPSTLVISASQEGEEKGVAALRAAARSTTNTVVLEGWHGRFSSLITSPSPAFRDYGLEPGTYTISMRMADMGFPLEKIPGRGWFTIIGPEPAATVGLCNSPSTLSFSTRATSLKFRIRSVDFQRPAHTKPWTFPGAEVWASFLDEEGNEVDSLDPTVWGLVQDDRGFSPYFVDESTLEIVWTGNDYGAVLAILIGHLGLYPTSLPGGTYTVSVNTFGYVMRRTFPVFVPTGGQGDIQVDLIQGGQIRVYMDFLHEFRPTAFNGFVRVEVYNAAGELAGASIYGMADALPFNTVEGAGGYLPYVPLWDWKVVRGPAEGAGCDSVTLPRVPEDCNLAQRAFTSHDFYNVPEATWADWPATDPSDANALEVPPGEVAAFDIFGFYWYYGASARQWANGWPTTNGRLQGDTGLRGSVDLPGVEGSGAGLYSVRVYAFDSRGPDNVPGTPDDWRSYYMLTEIAGVEVPWGSSVSVFVDMQNMARLDGDLLWEDMFGNFRNLAWASITATGSPQVVTYSLSPFAPAPRDPERSFMMWLPAGTFDVTVETPVAPAFEPIRFTITVQDGSTVTRTESLVPTGIPIPEFPMALPLAIVSTLAVAVYLLRRRKSLVLKLPS